MKDFHQKFNSFFLKAQDFEPEREFFLFLMDNFDQLPKTYALKMWKQIVSPSRRVGRPRAVRNPETGKIVNAERGVRQVIDGWESGSDVESIRCLKYPKTRMPPQKKFEIGKIRRILRRYKHLLNRPYDTK